MTVNDLPNPPDPALMPIEDAQPIPEAEPPKARRPVRFQLGRADLITGVLLIAILVFGAYLRFVGQNWDDYTHLHPDERFLTDVAERIGMPVLQPSDGANEAENQAHMQKCLQRYPESNGVGPIFDALCSTFYPPNVGKGLFVYGELPVFLVHFGGQFYAQITGDNTWRGYNGLHLVGRTLSATADVLTIFFVFLIGRRLFGRWVGLLGAFLYAVSVFAIQLSHFWTADAFSNLPVTIAFYFAVRVLDRSKWYDYLGFGAALGAAMASRINTLPLAGIVVLAAIIYCLPVFDITIPWTERSRLLRRAAIGLVIAGAATLIVFRFAYPHAFTGPSVFGIIPYSPFFDQIKTAQYQTSGLFDIPPNYQWVNRTPYLFAWRNIVLWGFGLPLGLAAWGGWLWAGIQILRARRQWTRHILLVTWILVYFGLLGKNWVATMRYYFPMYPALAILGAWMLVELVKRADRWRRANPAIPIRRLAWIAAVGVLVFVTVFSGLWGFGFTRIYTRLLTRVEASQWFMRNVPSAVSTMITTGDGQQVIFNVPYNGPINNVAEAPLQLQKAAPADGTFSTISFPHLLDTSHSGAATTLHIKVLLAKDNTPLAEGTVTADLGQTKTSTFGDAYTVTLNQPVKVSTPDMIAFQLYTEGNPVQANGSVIAVEGPWDDPVPYKVCPIPIQMQLTHDTPSGMFNAETCMGVEPFSEGYYAVVDNDGLYLVADDTESKRNYIQKGMDAADYITISSNRFYDTLPRDPARFPMTTAFYNALFANQLGFDVYKIVTSYITIGPITVPDEVLPTDNVPKWLNEWESEEAFTVYDHPAVIILKKNAKYDPRVVKNLLYGVNLNDQGSVPVGSYDSTQLANKVNWPSFQASAAPTGFMLTPAEQAIQRAGGTFSDLFNRDSPLNTSPLLAVIVWYVTLILFGWIAWPLLFVILPALPDRGYPIAKLAGLLIVSWLVWAGGTLRFLTWSAPGIAGAMLLLAIVSGLIAWPRRAELRAFIRERRRHILIVEGLTLALFLGFLLVRLGNPDIWAQTHGGERPMDFSYFNAVLRSTVFPPYDPWYAGGYLNYYYYGYVLVGTPVKLLGILPSTAYNLILPMLYAFTGIGAFSVAYNVVASRLFQPVKASGDSEPGAPFVERRRWALRAPAGSPYIAGVAALVMCVVLGNLDTPRTFFTGVANAGGYHNEPTDMYQAILDDFMAQHGGRAPTPEENIELTARADNPSLFDQIRFGGSSFTKYLNSLGNGLGVVLSQGYLPISPDRWYWGPRSVIGELPNASGEITEMPFFTFVFSDLHAHMMSMPLQLLALAWLLAEILGAGVIRRSSFVAMLATAFGALVVGILFPTNTWDWVTYMLLALAGLTFAAFLRGGKWSRRPILRWAAQIAFFGAAQQLFGLPFRAHFATGYGSASPFLGNKTPLWAYLDIHGLFIFVLFTLLVWQTARILRRTYVRDLLKHWNWVLVILALIGAILLFTIAFLLPTMHIFIFNPPYPAALIALPMIGWAAILFFLPDQSREMQIVLALTILALALTMGAEMVVLANDTGRQNTIFKLYEQVWLLFSVAGGVALAWLLRASERWRAWLRSPWLAFTALLISIAALYPIMATQGKIAMRMTPQAPHTLDGNEYMKVSVYAHGDKPIPLIDDYKLITWLQDHIQGSPVILEAQLPEYQLGSRITMNTGLPTVLGWRYHQTQQRSIDPLPNFVNGRMANVAGIYNTPSVDTARLLLRQYNVEYIIVGDLERAVYTPEGLNKFDQMARQNLLEIVYNTPGGNNRVYHVLPSAVALTDAMLNLNGDPTGATQ